MPQSKYLLIGFIACMMAMGGWLLYCAGLTTFRTLPLFPAILMPAVVLISSVIYGAKPEQKTPYLGYRSIFMPFCEYNFDFETQKWRDYCTD